MLDIKATYPVPARAVGSTSTGIVGAKRAEANQKDLDPATYSCSKKDRNCGFAVGAVIFAATLPLSVHASMRVGQAVGLSILAGGSVTAGVIFVASALMYTPPPQSPV